MTDEDLVAAISTVDLVGYLRARGWKEEKNDNARAVWTRASDEDQPFEVLVPLSKTYRDFGRLVRDLLNTLQVAEERPATAIINDLSSVSADIIRTVSRRRADDEATIPFVNAPQMLSELGEMLLAAACSAITPRPVYHSRKPKKALEYMDGLQLGQTERGSYVLKVISPVTPQLLPTVTQTAFALGTSPTVKVAPPFERQVTTLLGESLAIARDAAVRAVATGRMDDFQNNVARGISANFCRSLGALGEDKSLRSLGLSITWAASRPVEGKLGGLLFFEREALAAITEAGRVLSETVPEPDFDLHGHVIRLDKLPNDQSGVVTVLASVENKHPLRKISFQLSGNDYQTAIDAHRTGTPVTCIGELHKDGRKYTLSEAKGFRFDSDSEMDEAE